MRTHTNLFAEARQGERSVKIRLNVLANPLNSFGLRIRGSSLLRGATLARTEPCSFSYFW
jgi:hypothetical protein